MPPSTIEIPLTAAEAGQTLGALAAARLGEAGRLAAARGGLWLNGRRAAADTIAVAGATLQVRLPPAGGYCDAALTLNDLVYEDDDLLVVNKPAGAYVGATPWDTQGSVLATLRRLLTARDGVPATLHLAHQLDVGTSGLLALSKHPRANAPLQAAFASGQAQKGYLAVCVGQPPARIDVVTGHGRAAGGRWRLYDQAEIGRKLPDGSRVKLAHTCVITREQFADAALVWVIPLTGRTHQIRLHLAALGCPLLGDERYGGPTTLAGCAVAYPLLHAASLTLPHPGAGRPLRLFCPPPAQMIAVLNRLVGG